jgi:hypothetical protein
MSTQKVSFRRFSLCAPRKARRTLTHSLHPTVNWIEAFRSRQRCSRPSKGRMHMLHDLEVSQVQQHRRSPGIASIPIIPGATANDAAGVLLMSIRSDTPCFGFSIAIAFCFASLREVRLEGHHCSCASCGLSVDGIGIMLIADRCRSWLRVAQIDRITLRIPTRFDLPRS